MWEKELWSSCKKSEGAVRVVHPYVIGKPEDNNLFAEKFWDSDEARQK